MLQATLLGRPAMAARLGPQPALMVLGDEGSEQEDWASTYLMPRALLLVVAGIHIYARVSNLCVHASPASVPVRSDPMLRNPMR